MIFITLQSFYFLSILISNAFCISNYEIENFSLPSISYIKTKEADIGYQSLVSYEYNLYQDFKIGTDITFEPGSQLDVWLICNHSRPVKWVVDLNYATRDISITSYTLRLIGNYSDSKSYRYIALLRFILPPDNYDDTILMCEEFRNPFNRRILLMTSQSKRNVKISQVKSLKKEEENLQAVLDFEREEAKVKEEDKIADSNATCPFRFRLFYSSYCGLILYEWIEEGGIGTSSTIFPKSAQTVENAFRLTPILKEKCVDFDYLQFQECSENNALTKCPKFKTIFTNNERFHFRPIAFYNRFKGQTRVFKIFFDTRVDTVYFPSEKANVKLLRGMAFEEEHYIRDELVLFKGEEIKFKCHASVTQFSYGLVAMWALSEESMPREIKIYNDDDSGLSTFGTIYTKVTLRPSKEYLDQNNISNITITCFLPYWNSPEWVNISAIVKLLDSAHPEIIDLRENEEEDKPMMINSTTIQSVELKENVTIICTAKGIPLPTLEFIPEKQNLNYTESRIKGNDDSVSLILNIESIEEVHQGNYKCVAKNVVGEAYHNFEINIPKGISRFLKVFLILLGVVVVLFAIIASKLLYKYKKESEEFRRATEEAVARFQEGFKNAQSIDFEANSEYKDYELPLAQWSLGGTMLGSGAFGVVQKGFIQRGLSKIIIAVKTVNAPKDVEEFESSLKELVIMSFIGHHEHVVSLMASCTDNIQKRSLYIGVEFCKNGDLLAYIQKRKDLFNNYVDAEGKISSDLVEMNKRSSTDLEREGSFSTSDLYKWAYQIADGMAYLESKKVLHADLAARNILLTEDNVAKISDFGLSRQLMESNNYTKKTQSPLPWRWMAIECLKYQQFSSKSDVWAYGVTLYELFSLGELPWPGLGWTLEFVDELEMGRRLQKPRFAVQSIYDNVMKECWKNEPEERTSFSIARQFFSRALAGLNFTEENNEYLELET